MTVLVVGIGSSHGDDQAGWLLADRFRHDGHGELRVRRARSPVDLLDWLPGVDRLVICDACAPAGRPGRCHRWVWPSREICRHEALSSHHLPLADVLEVASAIGRLPDRVLVFAVEAGSCRPGGEVCAAVRRSLPRLEAAVREALAEA